MFKKILIWGTALLLLGGYASAQNFFISGGNAFSAVLCENGNVFTWGNNSSGQLGRAVLGKTSIPGKVDLDIKVSAVDAGSGSHAVALACDGTVWTWGEGKVGQLGNGAFDNSQTPVQVLAGETNSANPTDILKDVIYVTSGTSQSYAITADNKLVSWGSNRRDQMDGGGIGGQLGTDGRGWVENAGVWSIDEADNSPLPIYVRNAAGQILENVIAVDAGDYHCYALVDDDNDGDPTTGRVYSWGVAYMGENPVTANALGARQSLLASPVLDTKGNPLTGIHMITGGDAMGYFVQKGTGFVYSVGSNNEGQRGDGLKFVQATATDQTYNLYAVLVQSGELEPITGDRYLSNVTGISAGQTHGMAVVEYQGTSYMMTWGGNVAYVGGTLTPTGALGQKGKIPADNKVPLPGFVLACDGTRFKNVTSISDGDFTTYAVTTDPVTGQKDVWIWGHNVEGQVGLGRDGTEVFTTSFDCPQKFIEPECTMGQPCPVADLGAKVKYVCPGTGLSEVLYAGSDGPYSKYKWELIRPNNPIPRDITNTANGAYLPIRSIGRYVVTITDIRRELGVEMPCEDCPIVSDYIDILPLQSPFDTLFSSFCGSNGVFEVNIDPLKTTSYEFFSREMAGSPGDVSLGTSSSINVTQSGSKIQIVVNDLKNNAFDKLAAEYAADPSVHPTLTAATAADSVYSIWVEDKTISIGTILNPVTYSGTGNAAKMAKLAQLFTVYSDVYVRSAVVSVSQFSGAGGVLSLQPFIYKNKTIANGIIADFTATPIWTGAVQNFPMAMDSRADLDLKFEDALGNPAFLEAVNLRGSSYSLGFKVIAGAANFNMVSLGSNFQPISSSFGPEIQITDGTAEDQNKLYSSEAAGALSKFVLEKPSDYKCGRKELSIIKRCPPCNGIDASTLIPSLSSTAICNDGSSTANLSFAAAPLSTATAAKIGYQWFFTPEGGSTPAPLTGASRSGDLGAARSPFAVSAAGKYTIELYDIDDENNSTCQFSADIELEVNELPTYSFSGGGEICDGDGFSTVPVELALTGTGPWDVAIHDGTAAAPQTIASSPFTITPTAAAEYTLTSIEDANCPGLLTTSSAEVVVNPLPVITSTPIADFCAGDAPMNIASHFLLDGAASSAIVFDVQPYITVAGVFTPPATLAVATEYDVVARYENPATGCDTEYTAKVTVNPLPTVSLSLDPKYCSEATINFAAAASPTGGTFDVSPSVTLGAGTVPAANLSDRTVYTFTYNYEDANGCKNSATGTTYSVHVSEVASVTDYSVAGVKANEVVTGDLAATRSEAGAVLSWIDPSGTPLTGSLFVDQPTISVTHTAAATATEFEYKVYQTIEGCDGEETSVFFRISPCAALVPIAEDAYFCADEATKSITASLDASRPTDQIGWIDASHGSSGFISITSYTDPKVTGSPTKAISDMVAGDYKFYVAAWEDANGCWSSAKEVTFIVKANPVATVESQAVVACYNYSTPKPITVTPAHNLPGITPTFTVDGSSEPVPQYLPSALSAGGSMTITYKVDQLITPAAYHTPKSCASNVATEIYAVEYIAPPTFVTTPLVQPIDPAPYNPLVLNIANPAYTYKWYEDVAGVNTLIAGAVTNSYNPTKGVDYSNESLYPGDRSFTVSATQVTANGCESEPTTGVVELIRCPHLAPAVTGNGKECKVVYDDAVTNPTFTASTSAAGPTFTWTNAAGTQIGAGATFRPIEKAVGPHKVYVQYEAINTLTGLTCPSPKTEVEYEVYPMPVPSISGITLGTTRDLCNYDSPITLTGQNNNVNVAGGTSRFVFDALPAVSNSTYSFNPSINTAQKYEVQFEYTTANGCTDISAVYEIEIHHIDAPVVTDWSYKFAELINIGTDRGVTVKQTELIPAGLPAGQTANWYGADPGTNPTSYPAPAGTGATYEYAMTSPVPQDIPGVIFNENYPIWVVAADAVTGCKSSPAPIKLNLTNCPVPRPIVSDIKVCDYWTGTDIPALTATHGTWATATTPDPNVFMEYNLTGFPSLLPANTGSSYSFPAITPGGTHRVYFRAWSTVYDCGLDASAQLIVSTVNAPTKLKDKFDVCFDDDADVTFTVSPMPGHVVTWYDGPSKNATVLGTGTSLPTAPLLAAGTKTVYASAKMIAEPYCESQPSARSFEVEKHDIVPAPVLTGNTNTCMSIEDIVEGYTEYPSAFMFYDIYATSADKVSWFANGTRKVGEGPSLLVPENAQDLGWGVKIHYQDDAIFEAEATRTIAGGKTCKSERSSTVVRPKRRPLAPVTAGNTSKSGVYCQGSEDEIPVYEIELADELTNGILTWYIKDTLRNIIDEPVLDDDGNVVMEFVEIKTGAELNLEEYLESEGNLVFYATETFNGCESIMLELPFSVQPKPLTQFKQDYLRVCADVSGRHIISIDEAYIEEGSTYDWYFSGEYNNRADQWSDHPDGFQYAKVWFNTRTGIDMMTVVETNQYGCENSASILLYSADMVKPTFDYEYFYGVGEIVFANRESQNVLTDRVSIPALDIDFDIEDSLYTVYDWAFVHNASQRARTYQQKPVTSDQMQDVNYYIGYGPSVFYDSIKVEEKITPSKITAGAFDTTYVYTSVGKRKYVEGRKVNVWGGVPFEYGATTATLTRSIDGYDDRSCKRTSNEEQLFMKITTGLYIPTVFSPTHGSNLISEMRPFGHNLESFRMWVFDNWGNTVYYTEGVDDKGQPIGAWTGTDLNGNIMPADSYTWKVDATFKDGNKWEGQAKDDKKKKKAMGNILLIR
jgi:alpha-tubulin suppressor-like RCC1 family protein